MMTVGDSVEDFIARLRRGAEKARAAREQREREYEAMAAAAAGLTVEAYRARVEASRREAERLRLTRAANKAGVPEGDEIRRVVLDDAPRDTVAMRACREVLRITREEPGRPATVFLLGLTDRGKTCAMGWLAARATDAAWAKASEIAATPRTGWSDNETAWQRWLGVEVLCIDELGRGHDDRAWEPLNALLIERIDKGRATILAGNAPVRKVVDAVVYHESAGKRAEADGTPIVTALLRRLKAQKARGLDPMPVLTDGPLSDGEVVG